MNCTRSRTQWRWPGRALVILAALIAAATAAGDAATPPYVSPQDIDLARYLPPPPAPGSAAQRSDLEVVLGLQRSRTQADVDAAQADQKVSVFRFADVLGDKFSQGRLPRTAALGEKACREASQVVAVAKRSWNRPRPFVASTDVTPVVGNVTEGSYPSGHATCGYLWAILLSDMIPEKRAELFARGVRYGQNRVVGGVHFPSDAEAGRVSAAVIAEFLFGNAVFRADLSAARAEIRGVMGYSP